MPTDQRPYSAAVPGLLDAQRQKKWRSFSWITARALLSAINDQVSRHAPAMVRLLRTEWMSRPEVSQARTATDLVVQRTDCTRFVVIGDPGEQDASQYVVAVALADTVAHAKAGGDPITAVVICSDVIYPSGDINDYADGYQVPYDAIKDVPTYALPGNHDWYDGLTGFMWHWCGQERLPSSVYGPRQGSTPSWLFRLFWRRPSRRRKGLDLDTARQERWTLQQPVAGQADRDGAAGPLQPGPYFALELAHVLLVCIDTGIDGSIDHDQGEWLVEVSRRPGKPKLLLTGKPLLVNGDWHPCPIWSSLGQPSPVTIGGRTYDTVLEIVQEKRHGYVGTVGGDIHNYQRYAPQHGQQHIVSGGGGAYLSATHTVEEHRTQRAPTGSSTPRRRRRRVQHQITPGPYPTTMFPSEGESLSHFTNLFLPRVFRLARVLALVAVGVGGGWLIGANGSRPGHGPAPGAALAVIAGAVGVLFTTRFVLPAAATKTAVFRAGVMLNALLVGCALALVAWWLLPASTSFSHPTVAPSSAGHLLLTAAAVSAGLSVAGWALRWTAWWRPAHRPGAAEPDQAWRAIAVGVVLVAGAALAWLFDPWVSLALALTAAVAIYGWRLGRRTKAGNPRISWVRRGPALAYASQTLDVVLVGVRRLEPDYRADVGYAGAVALLVPILVVLAAVVVVLAVCGGLAAGFGLVGRQPPAPVHPVRGRLTRFRAGWGRAGWCAPWLLAVAVAGGLVLTARLLPDRHGSLGLGRASTSERRTIGFAASDTAREIGFTAAVCLILLVAVPILVDTLRRWVGRWYKLVCLAVVAASVGAADRAGAWSGSLARAVAAVAAILIAAVLSVAAAHLFFLGAFRLLLDTDLWRGRSVLLTREQADAVLSWRRHGQQAGATAPDARSRRRAAIVFPGVGEPQGPLQKAVSEVFDSDEPPFAKNFLVVTTTPEQVDVRAVFVTGDDGAPDPDHFTVALT